MAFSITKPNPFSGEDYQTYSRVTIAQCNKQIVAIRISHFLSEAAALADAKPMESFVVDYPYDAGIEADNPIEFAYKTLENSGDLPSATWNI